MDLITTILAGAGIAAIAAGTTAAVIARARINRANRSRRMALEAVDLVNSLLGAGSQVIAAGEIPKDSPAGQQILAMLEAECPCPNHEEQRRIKHAAAQAERDGK